ncbi:MAG: glycosyltransferase family 1 protein [Bacteroidales bacterium]|jgi:glycosyltransferase involved in cell wall biosynthesis|nr:glycosyltransferase family 1 protein [Bacteroidales bacterium]
MKVLFDYQIFQEQKFGGISRYFCEIISRFSYEVSSIIGTRMSENYYLQNLYPHICNNQIITEHDFFKTLNFKGKWRLYQILKTACPLKFNEYNQINKQYSIRLLKKQQFDIFHPTYYNPYFLEYIGNKPFVLTVHDMIHEKHPEYFSKKDKAAEWKKILIPRAHHIIAVSESTKQDVLEHYSIPERKISVIYHGSSLVQKITNIKIPKEYILFVGSREQYKNFIFLIESISHFLLEKNIHLVCIGSPFTKQEFEMLQKLQIKQLCVSIQADDIDMYTIYSKALFFIFPSLYEGFGIPILEAFEAQCPVLLSDNKCFREIAGEAALYFNALDSSSLIEQVNTLIHNIAERNKLKQEGEKQLQLYAWDKASISLINIYNNML